MIPAKKITLNLNETQYYELLDKLYHGQMTRLLKGFIFAMNKKINEEGKSSMNAWLEGESELTLPKINKEKME